MFYRAAFQRTELPRRRTRNRLLARGLTATVLLLAGCGDEGAFDPDASGKPGDPRAEFEAALGGMDFFFGNLHSHTDYSDGQGSAEEAFRWARDEARFDFYAVTDHAEFLTTDEWQDTARQADAWNEDDAFVALGGFEWSHPIFGHVCVYGTDDFTTALRTLLLSAFYGWLDQSAGLAQFNHPGREAGLFQNMRYEQHVADNFFAVETGNKDDGNSGFLYLPHYPSFLDMGWRLAPTSNQDNHKLQTNSHRTVMIGEGLSREALLDAMRSRRLYSSDDPGLRAVFKLGEAWMGSEVEVPAGTVTFTTIVEDDEPISQLELVTNGGTVAASRFITDTRTIVSWSPSVEIFGQAYFYLQVTGVNERLEDGDEPAQIAVTAPIWVRPAR
jgi:hypothetical protein